MSVKRVIPLFLLLLLLLSACQNRESALFRENFADGFLVADICLHESVIITLLHILEILQVSRIGQGIHINDTDLVIVFFEHVMNVVGTDKTGTACYQISSHFFSVLRTAHIFCYR